MTVDSNQFDSIYVPICTNETTKLTMKKLKECTFCDKEWYQLEFTSDLEDNVYLIHELIPLQTAKRLQIPSLINRTLEAEEFEYEEFGQTEPLTTRLHNILKDYNDGFAILKELIQNADDAGATEIRFLYDERQNKNARTKLIDKGMKGFQGPALWCYNDVEFTDEDFRNIVKLGGATKEQATEKIGRFGLGFNAVYNLTDVPMFVSRQYIAIFDPHTKYLGQALCNRNRPGIRLNMQNISQKIRTLTDQFQPFNGIFGCNITGSNPVKSYNGTLFRFALRTQEQAQQSEICQKYYDQDKVKALFECLHDSGSHFLLFTQNLRKISVFHIPESGGANDIKEYFSFDKELVRIIRNIGCPSRLQSELQNQCAILKHATVALKNFQQSNRFKIPCLELSSVLKISTCCKIQSP